MNRKILNQETSVKQSLVQAFDVAATKSISDVCRIVGVSRATYYFHWYKDPDFRSQVVRKQSESVSPKTIAA